MSDLLQEFGPAGGNIDCPLVCHVPEGLRLVQVFDGPEKWAMACPNDDCGRFVRSMPNEGDSDEQ